jgi:iron complex outermembrane receptor protein
LLPLIADLHPFLSALPTAFPLELCGLRPLPAPRKKLSSRATLRLELPLFFSLILAIPALAQQTPPPAPLPAPPTVLPKATASIVVTGTFIPAPLSESDRSVNSIDTTETPLLFTSDYDYLRLDPTIDLQTRAPNGVQADLSILGSTFAETLVLLNGLRMNDAESAHHNLDLPVPIEAISRIEVLHGAGSTFYGSDAMGGAVNFITTPARASEIRLLAGAGNQGFNQQHVLLKSFSGPWSETLAADRDFSTGFIPDRDYRNTLASSETAYKSPLGLTRVVFAGSDRPFGASDFYGDFPDAFERTKGWFTSAQQDLGPQTTAAFGFRRHSDLFILLRDDPSYYQNNHIVESWQAALRRHPSLRPNTTLSYGAEAQGDSIASNNLGRHARNREAIYGNIDFRDLSVAGARRFSFSAGAREEFFSGGTNVFTPSLAGGAWLTTTLKLHLSASRGFRLPTYTDLYYVGPGILGNALLKPESAWSLESGADWNPTPRISAGLTFFQRWDHNIIDYLQSAPGAAFVATNIDNVHFTGVEANSTFHFAHQQQLQLAYTFLHGNEAPLPTGEVSRYVFNYPSHQGVFAWSGAWRELLIARTRVGVTQLFTHPAYPVWDLSLARKTGTLRPYLQLANLSNTGYQETPGVLMPSRSVIGGMEILFGRKAK